MNDIKIRWANSIDSHDLGIIHSESFRAAYKSIIPDERLNNFTSDKREQYFLDSFMNRKENHAVLLVDDKAIGFMTLGKNRDEDLDETFGEIWGIYLLPAFWRKGYGKKLTLWGIKVLSDLGFKKITLWVLDENHNARKFYEELGFYWDGTKKEICIGKKLYELRYILSTVCRV